MDTETSAAVPGLTSSASPDTALRLPRSTGEIITDAVGVLRRHFGVIFAMAVPICAADLLVREVGTSMLLGINTALSDPGGAGPDVLLGLAPNFLAGMGFLAASFALQMLLNGSVTAVVADVWDGHQPAARRAVQVMATRGAPLLATSLLFLLVMTIAITAVLGVPTALGTALAIATDQFAFAIIGMLLGLPVAFVLLIVLSLRWSLYTPAVVCEGVSMFKALRRSSSISAGRGLPFTETPRFRLSVVLLVALAISSVLQSLFVAPRLLMAVATGWSFSDGGLPGLAQLPLWFAVPFGLVEVITNAAVIPLSGTLLALFFFDLRVRYDVDDTDVDAATA